MQGWTEANGESVCAEHDAWVLPFLLPRELEGCAPHALERVMATGETRVLWCEAGHHAVASSDSE